MGLTEMAVQAHAGAMPHRSLLSQTSQRSCSAVERIRVPGKHVIGCGTRGDRGDAAAVQTHENLLEDCCKVCTEVALLHVSPLSSSVLTSCTPYDSCDPLHVVSCGAAPEWLKKELKPTRCGHEKSKRLSPTVRLQLHNRRHQYAF